MVSCRERTAAALRAQELLDTLDARLYEMDEAIARAVPGGFSEKVWGLDNRQLYRIPEDDLTRK